MVSFHIYYFGCPCMIILLFFSLQSGAVPAPWSVSEEKKDYQKRAFGLGKLVGCDKEDTQQLVDCLVDVPADDIVQASQRVSVLFVVEKSQSNS